VKYKNFDDIRKYTGEYSLQDTLTSALENEIIIHQGHFSGLENVQELIEKLNRLTEGKYTVILGDTIYEEIVDIKENFNMYQWLYDELLSDWESKKVLTNILAYRLTRLPEYILDAYSYESEQYFDPSISVYNEDCVYVDCGGLDGYTVAKFMLRCPSYKRIYLYEPMENYYRDCVTNVKKFNVSNILLRKVAVVSKSGDLQFSANVKGNSKVSNSGEITVRAVSLDEDISEPVHFIKMDIEGSEKSALKGAKRHIRDDRPMLAICVYHLPSDLWEIPKIIFEMNSEYNFHLRHHSTNIDETVFYAVPKDYKEVPNNAKALAATTELACRQFINQVEEFETLEQKKAKVYLLKQLANYKQENEKQLSIINELKSWTAQLTEAKEFLKSQVEHRDDSIVELKKWIVQLEEARDYYLDKAKDCNK
jgi:FkbM family methyltransferase